LTEQLPLDQPARIVEEGGSVAGRPLQGKEVVCGHGRALEVGPVLPKQRDADQGVGIEVGAPLTEGAYDRRRHAQASAKPRLAPQVVDDDV
ncbi:hypothetical protein DF186_16310, partial [Enterococcus hirae]